eukprot:scaffold10266_cov58-Phaeocystis_antarctica.AAC.4
MRGRGATAAKAACTGRAQTQGWGGQDTRGAHHEHALPVRDLGRVEAERLVERRRVRPGRREGVGGGDASGMNGEGPTQGWGGQGTRGAHPEHVAHGRDLGRVKAERLVERRRPLPIQAGVRRGRRYSPGGVRAWGGGDASRVHGEGPTQGCGGQGTRGAHVEHVVHVCDLGRVEAERLVERVRLLPSRKAGMRCGRRCGPGGVRALGGGDASGVHGEGPTQGCGAQGTRGAHSEHGAHGRDLGRVEAERLVERVR